MKLGLKLIEKKKLELRQREKKKLERWQRIAAEATEQSERLLLPVILPPGPGEITSNNLSQASGGSASLEAMPPIY